MTFDAQYLQLPREGRGPSLLMRFMILILNFTAFICLCVNLGLYHKRMPMIQEIENDFTQPEYNGEETYDQQNVPAVRYWEDPVVLVVVLFSLIWTVFVYLRSAWTRKALHPGAKIVFELLLFLIILTCSIPAFIFSPLQQAIPVDLYLAILGYCIYGRINYCRGDEFSLQRLQAAAYALVWVVAFFHFCLFCGAFYEYRNPVKDFEAEEEIEENEEVAV